MSSSYVMSGKELEALCEASGYSWTSFWRRLGWPPKDMPKLRAKKRYENQIDFSQDIMARSCIDQMRARIGGAP